MGKVISSFNNGFPGAVSRSVDDVIVAMPNGHTGPIPFGAPVIFDSMARQTVVPFSPGHTADEFVGIVVRRPVKAPDTYETYMDQAEAQPHELCDVLVRGSCVISQTTGSPPRVGGTLHVRLEDNVWLGAADGTEGASVELANVHARGFQDGTGCIEVVVNSRNLI